MSVASARSYSIGPASLGFTVWGTILLLQRFKTRVCGSCADCGFCLRRRSWLVICFEGQVQTSARWGLSTEVLALTGGSSSAADWSIFPFFCRLNRKGLVCSCIVISHCPVHVSGISPLLCVVLSLSLRSVPVLKPSEEWWYGALIGVDERE